jgi:hypothetical protein
MAKKKDNRLIFIVVIAISALAIANVYILTSKGSPYCYNGICLSGKENPVAEIKSLMNSSSRAIIVVEGDAAVTQKTPFLNGILMLFAKDFANKGEQIIAINMKDGVPVNCTCTTNFYSGNFTDCSGSVDYCTSIAPGQSEMMLKVYYPSADKNEIVIENSTVSFYAKSGQDAFAAASLFEDIFIHKVVG